MHIAILGAGFTGLTAALRLLQKGHEVTIFEKEESVGGLAGGFKLPEWNWTLEKSYHHWFTNDTSALNLASQLNHPVIIKRPKTDVWVEEKISQFDSPLSLLTFSHLPLVDRLRTGLAAFYLKATSNPTRFEGQEALPWLNKYMGRKVTDLIWKPLFIAKFGDFWKKIALTWFWARIYKRTSSLAYPEGGFQSFADKIAEEIKKLGGDILLHTAVLKVGDSKNGFIVIANPDEYREKQSRKQRSPLRQLADRDDRTTMTFQFDKVISTLPSPILSQITQALPKPYTQRINSIPHLHAQTLILVLKKPFLKRSYWLNITQKDFPFLVLAEHTNFMDSKYYGDQHILYIGNYLPLNHPYLKLSAKQLLKIFDPYLKKIRPNYQLSIVNCQLFSSPFAQPVVTTNYPQLIPSFQSPLKNLYIANMDMVYPWDRGTNYAIEMGEKVAEFVEKDLEDLRSKI